MVRVIVNGVSFYTTKRALRDGRVGDNYNLNRILQSLYGDLHNAVGIGTRINTFDHNKKSVVYDIQISI
jgi:hypothetical protein